MHSKIYRSRLLVCILSMMIIMTAIFPINTLASGNLGVTVGSVTGEAGGSVVVPVSLSNIPINGLAATSIIITFDSTKLTLTGVSAGAIVPTATDVVTTISDVLQSPGKAKIFYSDANAGQSNTHITSNGVLANLTFSIGASASGPYTLGVDAASEATENNFDATTIPYTGMTVSTGTVTLIPTISPATASFDKNSPSDKLVIVTLNGNDLNSITNGAYTLGSQDCDTTVMPNLSSPYTPTTAMTFIKSDYLSQQSVGTTTLSFNFSGGSSQTFTITVVDTSPASTNYTVTYNAGANGSISGSGNESVTSGAYPASVPTVTPAAGYNFAYWSSDEGTTQLTSAQLAAQTISANVTYTAYYTATANQTYTVTFDSQDGSAVTSISNVTTGSSITAPTAPTWAGHNFGGWYKEAGCTNAWIFNTDTVTNNVTLYAKWTAAENLGVTIGSVTGEAGGSVIVPVSLSNIPSVGVVATSIIVTFDSTKLNLTGVSAGGIVPTAEDVTTDTNDVIQSPGKAKLFYFDHNAGIGTPDTHITTNGVLANLTFSIDASANGEYNFGVDAASEITDNDVNTIGYSGMNISTGTLTVNANATELIPTISPATASFDKNSPSNKLVTVTLNGNDLNSITNGEYTLVSQDCDTTLMPNLSPPYTPTLAMTFIKSDYLSQQSVGTTTLSFNFSGGSSQTFTITVVDTSPASTNYTVTYNAGVNGSISGSGNESVTSGAYPASVPTVTPAAGYNFAYWSSDEGTTQLTSAQLAAQTISANVTYIAYYTATANQTYTVTFDSQGGSAVTSISNVTTGSAISAPTEPTRTGYTFGGWYKESDCTNVWDFNTDSVTNNVTIYAKWTANPVTTYTVSFDSQGGSAVTSINSVTTGSSISAPAEPTRTGYTFGGWYKESDCLTPWDFSTDSVTNNVTIYAKWTANPSSNHGGNSGGSSTPTSNTTPTSTPTTVTGKVIDKTGELVKGVEAQVTVEANGTSTVAVKSNEAILLKQPDGTKAPLSDSSKLGFLVEGNTNSNANAVITLSADGTIQVKNLANGTESQIAVTYDLGNGQKITIGTIDIKVGSNGEVSLTSTLIDPYGIITDSATGKVITGADVTLYYADTARNIASGKTPDTLVALPIIDGFKPNNNKNPQISDLSGAYGFMVFPTTDYYIVATKEEYDQFRSPTIPVEQEIVKLDFKMNQPKIGLTRLAGLNSVDTALEIAKANYTGQVSNVILATAENFPDALAGSVLAYKLNAPILLVGSSEEDQTKVTTYLKDYMNPKGTVYILGGTAAVSKAVEGKITAGGFSQIRRLGGYDRYETALKIADELDLLTGTPIVLAYGENYPDALSISSAAAAMQYPILLVGNDGISDAVQKKIAAINPIRVYIIGGQAVINSAVENQVSELTSLGKGAIVRLNGVDRYETSLAVANYFKLSGQTVCVATGNNFPDALTGSVYGANSNAPIILTDINLSDKVMNYLKTRKSTGVTIFGGEAVVNKAIEQKLSEMLTK